MRDGCEAGQLRHGHRGGHTGCHCHGRGDGPQTLADLGPGEAGRILAVGGPPAVQARLRDLGFLESQRVRVIKIAPLSDPMEYCVLGVHVGLRRHEARLILVDEVELCAHADGRHDRRPSMAALLRELPGRLRGRGRGSGWGHGWGRGWGRGRGGHAPHGESAHPEADR